MSAPPLLVALVIATLIAAGCARIAYRRQPGPHGEDDPIALVAGCTAVITGLCAAMLLAVLLHLVGQ